jgi:L-iditol 2-dehydrogenase
MKAVVVHSPGDVRWQEIPDPAVPSGWVRVAVKAVGVCTSDIGRALHGSAYHYPIVLGHEIGGIVAEVGTGIDDAIVGRRVAVAPLIPCGRCEWCERGRYSMCDDYDYLGSRRDGGCAEFVIAPERNLVYLPENVSLEDAGVLEPASVTLHGLDGRVRAHDDVVILGAGNLGLFAVQQARILGAGRVFVIDLLQHRLDIAAGMGGIPIPADANNDGTQALKVATGGRLADLVVDTCGVASVQANALAMVRKGGRIVFMGLPSKDVCIPPKNFNWLVRSEIELSGSWNSFSAPFPGAAWHANVGYLASGRLTTAPIITHRFELEEAGKAYRYLDEGHQDAIKVLLLNESASIP